LPFRLLNRGFGCELAFVEMLNVRSVSFKSRKTQQMLATVPEDRPLGIQFLGNEPKYIQRAMEVIQGYAFDLLDFNAACPAKKVIRRGEGASLLKDPKKLNALLRLVVRHSPIPVTVKIRIGWDKDCINVREVALYCQDAGAAAIFIHGRTKEQGYGGRVDYQSIAMAKKALRIPVIASGDIFSAALAKKMFDQTGCDGITFARGALGNPWIFRESQALLDKGKLLPRPELGEIKETMLAHLAVCADFFGERVGVVKFRKFFAWYTKGFRKIRPLREKSSQAKTKKEMDSIIQSCR